MQPTEVDLAFEGGGCDDRAKPQGLADRMREAWALRDAHSEIGEKRSEEREAPQSLADRLRAVSKGLDQERESKIKRERGLDHGL